MLRVRYPGVDCKMIIDCCKDCHPPERHPGCGDMCKVYKDMKLIRQKANDKRQTENKVDQYVRALVCSNRQKSMR